MSILNNFRKAQQPKWTVGDVVYSREHYLRSRIPAGTALVITSVIQISPIRYDVENQTLGLADTFEEHQLTKAKPAFRAGDNVTVHQAGDGVVSLIEEYHLRSRQWMYQVELSNGSDVVAGEINMSPASNVTMKSQNPLGQPAPQSSKFNKGQVVYITLPVQVAGGPSRVYTHDVGKQASIRQHNPPSGYNQEQWQIEFFNGDQVWVGEEYLTTRKPKFDRDDIVVEKGSSDQWRIDDIAEYTDFGQGFDWYYVLIDVNSIDIDDTNIHNKKESELSLANQQQQQTKKPSKFKDGDRVSVVVPGRKTEQATVVNIYPTDADGEEWYVIQYDAGDEETIDGSSLQKVVDSPQPVHDPESYRRQDMHPSMQELLSHIKDTGTPYFPPTPQGQKDFEAFLIQQHAKEMEGIKDNWAKMAKRIGKVRADIIKRQQLKAIYTEAMKYRKQ